MGSSGQKTKGLLTPICQAYKNQLCGVDSGVAEAEAAAELPQRQQPPAAMRFALLAALV